MRNRKKDKGSEGKREELKEWGARQKQTERERSRKGKKWETEMERNEKQKEG